MKTKIALIAAALTLQAGILFANNESVPAASANAATCITTLSPTTPMEATFEEESLFDFNQLVPVTPAEATFEDISIDMISTLSLAPVVPAIADFDDFVAGNVDNGTLAPCTPAEADFE